jgi:RNA polymerase sigma-70 factor (ECF subfamily)
MRKEAGHTEDQLLAGFREGWETSFTTIFEALYPSLCYYALRYTNDQAAAEDIAEEVFLKVWNKRDIFFQLNVLKSYLYTTARNASLDWLNQQKRQREAENGMAISSPERKEYILEDMIHAEWLRGVTMALDSLPPRCRTIVNMLFIDGRKAREVAQELQITINTVKKQRANGLKLLRKRFPDILTLLLLLNF